jgi:hypothetical protein
MPGLYENERARIALDLKQTCSNGILYIYVMDTVIPYSQGENPPAISKPLTYPWPTLGGQITRFSSDSRLVRSNQQHVRANLRFRTSEFEF